MDIEHLSKLNRILDVFRGRSRATDKNDNHTKDQDRFQVQFINKMSME